MFYFLRLLVFLLYGPENRCVAEINNLMPPEIKKMNDNRDYQCKKGIKHIRVKEFHRKKFKCKDKKSQQTTDFVHIIFSL